MYYCFLCNRYHFLKHTEEHFIPRSIDGPEKQWLPVCSKMNTRSNAIIDNNLREIFYMERFSQTGAVKRYGIALLKNGLQIPYKFSYTEDNESSKKSAFNYFVNPKNNEKIKIEDVYAIGFHVGLLPYEQEVYCRAIVKISIGTLVYCLNQREIRNSMIRKICSNQKINNLRCFALDMKQKKWKKKQEIAIGRTEVIKKLHSKCKDTGVCNHAINISFLPTSIVVEGMLYSRYGWKIEIGCDFCPKLDEIFLENSINRSITKSDLVDKTLSPDGIIVINPDYIGQKPEIPDSWKNK